MQNQRKHKLELKVNKKRKVAPTRLNKIKRQVNKKLRAVFPELSTNMTKEYVSLRALASKIADAEFLGVPCFCVTENPIIKLHRTVLEKEFPVLHITDYSERRFGLDLMEGMDG